MLRKRLREYFTFTKKERNGIIVLLFLLVILIIVRVYQNNLSYGEIVLMNDDFKNEIEEFEKSLVPKESKEKKVASSHTNENLKTDSWTIPKKMFEFDPNKVSINELQDLGLSEKQIKTFINYREKGGRFFQKNDVLKIYGIDEKQYKFLEPYIIINLDKSEEAKEVENEFIEINSAHIEELIKIKGIGTSYAKKIIKYRNILGGYYNKNQLLEVYGMDSIRYLGIVNQIIIDTNKIIQINLNKTDFKTLIKHPYLNKYQTEAILKFKELEGEFSDVEQIYNNKLLTKKEYLKVKPYLKLK